MEVKNKYINTYLTLGNKRVCRHHTTNPGIL